MADTAPSYCERCDLPLAHCEHGQAPPPPRRAAARLEVSPRQLAHFPGCPHKGDDDDFTGWGFVTIDTAQAWESIGNGHPVEADAGDRVGLLATARCRDCHDHGPWG